jgi:diguanylate cyclase (GGDEF)-like protein
MPTQDNFNILLVDDDPLVIHVMNRIVRDGASVRFATSGQMALKLARESVPDLMLLDVEMPELGGFEICRIFKEDRTLAEVPIILVTGHDSAELEAKGLQLGAADFITKPPHAALVLARVRTFKRMKALSDTIRTAVCVDFLTGAATRREFERTLAREWLRARRSAAPLTLLVADIRGFTAYNQEYGEEQGDACLKAIADALRSSILRPADVMGRFAGGKFAILLPETGIESARTVAQRVIDAVDALQLVHAKSATTSHIALIVGGCSGGFSRLPVKSVAAGAAFQTRLAGATPDDLIAGVEEALEGATSAAGRVLIVDLADLVDFQEVMISLS